MQAPSSGPVPITPPTPEESETASTFLYEYLRPEVKRAIHHIEFGFTGISENDDFVYDAEHEYPSDNQFGEEHRLHKLLMPTAKQYDGMVVVTSEEGEEANVYRFKMRIKIPRAKIHSSMAK